MCGPGAWQIETGIEDGEEYIRLNMMKLFFPAPPGSDVATAIRAIRRLPRDLPFDAELPDGDRKGARGAIKAISAPWGSAVAMSNRLITLMIPARVFRRGDSYKQFIFTKGR